MLNQGVSGQAPVSFRDEQPRDLMRTQRFVSLFVLLVALVAGSLSVSAEEKSGALGSTLSGTTVSGYVDSSANWQVQPATNSRQEPRGWWQRFLQRLGFHRRG